MFIEEIFVDSFLKYFNIKYIIEDEIYVEIDGKYIII